MRQRWLAATMALMLGLGGCSAGNQQPGQNSSGSTSAISTVPPNGVPAADDVAKAVVAALNKHDLSGVPTTTTAAQVQEDFDTIVARMNGRYPSVTAGQISYEGADQAKVALTMSWQVGLEGWEYPSQATLRYADSQWKLEWQPSLIHPDLTSDSRLRYTQKNNKRAEIKDTAGNTLVEERPLYQVGIDKTKITENQWAGAAQQLAQALNIDVAAYQKKVAAAGEKAFVVAATMEQHLIPASTADVPGIYVNETSGVQGPAQNFAEPLLGTVGKPTAEMIKKSEGKISPEDQVGLSGLQYRYNSQLQGVPLVKVDLVGRAASGSKSAPAVEEKTLFQQDASVGSPITISLNQELQTKAEAILSTQSELATLVVIDIKTGALLTAAQSPAGGSYSYSTMGAFSPGSTFKVVTSLAMLRQGQTPSSEVQCPSKLQVDTFQFSNYSSYPASATGTVSLETAFKYSCNTAFLAAANTVDKEQLQLAAASLGVGVDYNAGFGSNFGTVNPADKNKIDLAASMIGQGKIVASPIAMAGVAASVASGKTVIPWLVEGQKATSAAEPLRPAEAAALQQMMQATVDSGTGSVVKGIMTGAKTGTAGFGNGDQSHAWMIAYNDKYAVSAFVKVGESGGSTAGPLIVQLFS